MTVRIERRVTPVYRHDMLPAIRTHYYHHHHHHYYYYYYYYYYLPYLVVVVAATETVIMMATMTTLPVENRTTQPHYQADLEYSY